MKVLWSWLLELCDLDKQPAVEEGARALTRGGLEIEGMTDLGAGFTGVVVAQVVGKKPHPQSDKLTLVDVITERGWGEHFIHRTGHSIDRELHGSGPNIDNLESRDTRRLIPGVGFSIEPGIYLAGDVGFRSEVNVWMGPDGPEVTTPEPQTEVYALLSDPRFA